MSIAAVTFNCHDAATAASFWSAAFGIALAPEPAPSEYLASFGLSDPDAAASMVFVQVSEGKRSRVEYPVDHVDRP
ncbi:MAG: VOC family protein [Acidimicrobiales bacterium]